MNQRWNIKRAEWVLFKKGLNILIRVLTFSLSLILSQNLTKCRSFVDDIYKYLVGVEHFVSFTR